MRILLLGATGEMGGRTASELLRNGDLEHLTLAGRNEGRLRQLSDRLRHRGSIATRSFDIRTSTELLEHVREHDLVVSCAGPAYELEDRCVRAAVEAKTPYVSLNDDLDAAAAARRLGERAVDAGVSIISGCGAAPGLSNLLAAIASSELDTVDEIQIGVAASSRDGGGAAAELHFVSMLNRAAASGSGSPHPVYFPEPVGWIETFGCGHPEELSLASTSTGAAVRFRIGLAEKAVMDVIRASVATRLTASEPLKRGWLRAARVLQPVLEGLTPGDGGWTALRVDVHGRLDARARTISYGVVDHLVNLASITISEAAARLAGGAKPGVLAPEEALDAKDLLRTVTKRGLRFARLEPHDL